MTIISQTQRYIPHELKTKYYAVKLYRNGYPVSFVCRRYKISKASLMRWNKKFDGSKKSLIDKSHRPLTPHPNSHTEEEIKWIKNYLRRNPNISLCELYGKLRVEKGYCRHATSVKYVPKECYTGKDKEKFYQYTMIDEASRERFIYPYKEQSSYSTVDFVKRAIVYFNYQPQIIQTDNGSEFTHTKKTDRVHPLDVLLNELNIKHQLIRPRTPRHNGKVERSHRNDQNRFYNFLKFYSYEDLIKQMKAYLKRSNNIPMQVLGWISPIQKSNTLKEACANALLPN